LIVIATAVVSLIVNASVLRMMRRFRQGEAHLRATWLFTRVDVIANLAVIVSGLLILLTGFRFLDLMVGAGIGLFVVKEAVEIIGEARRNKPGVRVGRSR
jgi:Co/Zn/Cd efflux system component